MKLIVVACLAAVTVAAPTSEDLQPIVQVLRDERQHGDNGNFRYLIEADNGIFVEASGAQGPLGQTNIQGSYRLVSADGILEEVRYIADELGVRVESSLLPTPHPLPAHALEQIRLAEEQRSQQRFAVQ